MTVEAIKDAISRLSEPEQQALTDWFDEWREQAWDRQIERDFAPGGRAARFMEKVDRQIAAGEDTCLLEGLRLRREQRAKR